MKVWGQSAPIWRVLPRLKALNQHLHMFLLITGERSRGPPVVFSPVVQ